VQWEIETKAAWPVAVAVPSRRLEAAVEVAAEVAVTRRWEVEVELQPF